VFVQVTSYFWILYIDTIFFTKGVIAYFSDEFYSSWTAWLGCALLVFWLYVENRVIEVFDLLRSMYRQRRYMQVQF